MSNYSDSAFNDDPNSSWYKVFNFITENSSVMDVGCSSGNFGKVLAEKKGCTVDGIELDESDVELATPNLRNVYHLNIETDDLGGITETYDFVYFGDVVEHLFWPIQTLKRVQTLLKPGGKVVFSIPNMAHISVRLMLLGGDFRYGETGLLDKTHLHYYTNTEVERVFTEAGYGIPYFDPVLKDLPEELVKSELAAVGLELTPAFLEFMRTSEASIYQFVGAAEVAVAGTEYKPVRLDASSPVDKFQQLLDQTKEYYEAQLTEKTAHLEKVEQTAHEVGAEYQKALEAVTVLEAEIHRLNDSHKPIFQRAADKLKKDKD